MILVTAANGNQGKMLIPKLVAAGLPVRACVQSEQSAEHLVNAGVTDVLVADISEPLNAARAVQVKHFVFSSVLHAITSDLVQHAIKRDIEEHLLSSGLEFTILQPANYMLPLKLKPAFEESVFRLSWSLDRRQSMVDLDDVTDVALAVLRDGERHYGATYELVGSGRYTAYELAGILAAVVGREIEVEQISADRYLKAWFGDASPDDFPHQATVLRSISARYSRYDSLSSRRRGRGWPSRNCNAGDPSGR